jgi:hypothetical protein
MAETIDEITISYEEEDGTLVVKELDKKVLSKGAWATLMFRYQDLDKNTGEFRAPKVTIRRYQKVNGEFRPKSKFNISSDAQAKLIIEALQGWMDE